MVKLLRTSVPNARAQPAMRGIGIQPRVPEQGNRDLRRGDRKGKTMHAGAQGSGVSFGNTGDQVGGPSESQRGRKSTDGRNDLPFQPERLQGFINRSLVEIPPRDTDVPAGRITGGRDLALAQRVPQSHNANETISEQ